MPLGRKYSALRSYDLPIGIFLSLLLFVSVGLGQHASSNNGGAPKYDQKTETKTKGVIDEVRTSVLGSRKDFIQLIVKSGDDKIPAYICPKPFQDEMGITFNKGDEITLTGSKVKQENSDVILVRELERGTDTLVFRDDKGGPVWDWRSGK
jgi:hypothetical protein